VRSDPRGARGTSGAVAVAVALLLAGCTPIIGQAHPGATASDVETSQPGPTSSGAAGASPSPGQSLSPSPTGAASASPSPSLSPSAGPSPTSSAPSTAPVPTRSPAPPKSPSPAAASAPAPGPALLRSGDEGAAVAQVQRRLRELGYFLPAVDSDFGSNTRQAVWALQKAAGISRDGVVGPSTRAALAAGIRPTPRSTTGHVLEVDLDRQLVLAVQDGRVVATINASSGSGRRYEALGTMRTAFTPRGDFTVVQQIDGTHYSTLELGAMYRPKYFRAGWAIHGSPSVPPYPASHGCVRVSNDAIDWIWDQFKAPVGTPILVHGG